MIIVSSGTGTVTNINTTAPLSGGPITTSGTITTAMATNKLIGRSTAGSGVMEEITVGTGLSLTGGTLSSIGGATAAGNTNEIQFNNGGAFAASSNLDWIISDNRLLLGSENTADINSRMVVIGKGISTNNTFVVHNSTGTNNSLIVRDDGFVGVGTNAPNLGTIFRIVNSSNNYFDLSNEGGIAIGRQSTISTNTANNNFGVAVGFNTEARGTNTAWGIALGFAAKAGIGNVALGQSATAGFIGSFAGTSNAIAIGANASANTSGGGGGIAIGRSANGSTSGTDNIVIGQDLGITSNSNAANILFGRFLSVTTNSRSNTISIGSGVNTGSRAVANIDNSFGLYFANNERSFFVNSLSNVVLRSQQSLAAGTQYDSNATNTFTIHNGTAPASNISDAFQFYSADIVAGNAAPHFRTENGNVVKIYQETTSVPSATFIQNSGSRVDEVSTFDGYTIAQVVRALRNQGLLA
jgi:hypothetical protein